MIYVSIFFIILLIGVGSILWYFYMKLRYKTVRSNEALIITGPNLGNPDKDPNIYKDDEGRYMKVIRGGGARLKLFQTSDYVSLKSFQLHITTPKVYTEHGVGIYGEAIATIKVADTLGGIVKYAEQFLGKEPEEYQGEVSNVLSSNLRAILSKMSVEDINSNRESFNEEVVKIAQDQLDRMGFQITSLGLTDIRDDEGYLENLGKPEVAKIKKIADIAEAENERETEINRAEVNEEVEKERFRRGMNIAEARKEKEVNDNRVLAEINREKAVAEASYELEQEERRLITEKQRLQIKEQERDNAVELEKRQVQIAKEKADADYYREIRKAEAEAKAKIEQGKAEAEVIRRKNEAEVEAIEKRAKALQKHGDVILREKLIELLPEFAKAVSEPIANVESIRILDNGSGDKLNSIPSSVTNIMANLQESMGQMTGLDLENVLRNLSDNKDESIENNTEDPENLDFIKDETIDS